jgi:hypothetical protein
MRKKMLIQQFHTVHIQIKLRFITEYDSLPFDAPVDVRISEIEPCLCVTWCQWWLLHALPIFSHEATEAVLSEGVNVLWTV